MCKYNYNTPKGRSIRWLAYTLACEWTSNKRRASFAREILFLLALVHGVCNGLIIIIIIIIHVTSSRWVHATSFNFFYSAWHEFEINDANPLGKIHMLKFVCSWWTSTIKWSCWWVQKHDTLRENSERMSLQIWKRYFIEIFIQFLIIFKRNMLQSGPPRLSKWTFIIHYHAE